MYTVIETGLIDGVTKIYKHSRPVVQAFHFCTDYCLSSKYEARLAFCDHENGYWIVHYTFIFNIIIQEIDVRCAWKVRALKVVVIVVCRTQNVFDHWTEIRMMTLHGNCMRIFENKLRLFDNHTECWTLPKIAHISIYRTGIEHYKKTTNLCELLLSLYIFLDIVKLCFVWGIHVPVANPTNPTNQSGFTDNNRFICPLLCFFQLCTTVLFVMCRNRVKLKLTRKSQKKKKKNLCGFVDFLERKW